MVSYMERRKSFFKWYWLLDEDARLPLALAVGVGLFLLFPHHPYLWAAAAYLLGITMRIAGAYQKGVYERLGPDRVRPPKALTMFWWILFAIDLLAFALGITMILRKIE
jgi:hypothetical protein